MNTGIFKKSLVAVTALSSIIILTGCGDVVVKVEKKSKSAEIKSTGDAPAGELNLNNAEDFLRHLDGLKVNATDLIIRQLASKDYVGEFRAAVRNYRSFLIERARMPVSIDDSFYTQSAEQCRKTGVSLNMDEANEFLGLILKTALLAKIGEVSATNLNPGLSKEIAAISRLIMAELGVKIEGTADVTKADGVTTSKGKFSLSLAAIQGEMIKGAPISAEMIARDAAEVLSVEFERALGADMIGTFGATFSVGSLIGEGQIETFSGSIKVERSKAEGRFVHQLEFAVGAEGQSANYKRAMKFEQHGEKARELKVSDTIAPGMKGEATFVTIIDLEKGTQCKVDLGKQDDLKKDVVVETPVTPEEPKKDAPTPDEGNKVVDPSKPVVTNPTPGQHNNSPGQHSN